MTEVIKKSTQGFVFTFLLNVVKALCAVSCSIYTAKILTQNDFGQFTLILLVTNCLIALSNWSCGIYLIQHKESGESIFFSLFIFQFVNSIVVASLFLFFEDKVLSLSGFESLGRFFPIVLFLIFVPPLINIPRSLLEKELKFFKGNIPNGISILGQTIATIYLVFSGFGVWSLVYGYIVKVFLEALFLLLLIYKEVKFNFKMGSLGPAVKFGLPLILSNFMVFFYWNIDYFLIALILNETDLGYYTFAFTNPHHLLMIGAALNTVCVPMFSKLYPDLVLLEKSFHSLVLYTAYLMFGFVLLTNLFGYEIIVYIFHEKWLPALIPFQILMYVAALRIITMFWSPLLQSRGITKYQTICSLFNLLGIFLLGYFLLVRFGIVGMSIGVAATMCISSMLIIPKFTRIVLKDFSYMKVLFKPILLLVTFSLIGVCIKGPTNYLSCTGFYLYASFTGVIYILTFVILEHKSVFQFVNVLTKKGVA